MWIIVLIVLVLLFLCLLGNTKNENEERDKYIWERLQQRYVTIPDDELYWIFCELNYVCDTLFDIVYYRQAKQAEYLEQIMIQGNYTPLYTEAIAKQKLQVINSKYGWNELESIQFSTDVGPRGAYENRYFLAYLFNKHNEHGYTFHFKDK